ncbi:hypothetical protein ACPZ19_18890 [Amycolatopsis lurida]
MSTAPGDDPLVTVLVEAMTALADHVPAVAKSLLSGELPAAKRREFAEMLTELADLLTQHAAEPATPPS